MVKKVAIIFVLITAIIFPINVLAEGTGGVIDEAGKKYDRQQKQGEQAAKSSSKDVKAEIEKNKKMFDYMEEGKTTAAEPDEALQNFSNRTYSFTGQFLFTVQKNSFPICLLGVIAGALIYYAIGPRNMARRRYGSMLMFGFFTLFVIAQIAPVLFLLMIQQ